MIAVSETSAGLMGFRARRNGRVDPDSATFEVALNGTTLAQLRAAAAVHHIGVGEAILRAIEYFNATQGNQYLYASPIEGGHQL